MEQRQLQKSPNGQKQNEQAYQPQDEQPSK
nr:MAG TPA: hypothetical protein [Microviridae sp.]